MKHLTETDIMNLLQKSSSPKDIFSNSSLKNSLGHLETCAACFAQFWDSFSALEFLKNEKISFSAKLAIKLASIGSAFTMQNADAVFPLALSPVAAVRDAQAEGLYSKAEVKLISKMLNGAILNLLIYRKLGCVYFQWKTDRKTSGSIGMYVNENLEEKQSISGSHTEFMFNTENLEENKARIVSFKAQSAEFPGLEELVEVRVS